MNFIIKKINLWLSQNRRYLISLIIFGFIAFLIVSGKNFLIHKLNSDPIVGVYKQKNVYIAKQNVKGRKKVNGKWKSVGRTQNYLRIELTDENGNILGFDHRTVKKWFVNIESSYKFWNTPEISISGLNEMKSTILNAPSVTVKYRENPFGKQIDEVILSR
tara:strand:+ start:557 stop:1039 length:483 start_codon:yes stop_codon:yes gene_type:complete